MKAIVFHTLHQLPSIQDVNLTKGDRMEQVDLSFASFNHRDLWIVKGMYPGIELNTIMGSDGVGYCDGKRVIIYPALHWGDREMYQSTDFNVLGVPAHGTFAKYHFTAKENLYDVPSHLDDASAAALPVAGLTAFRALFVKANLRPGQNILISGVGGGVAVIAAQMAVAFGANVYVTSSSSEKIDKAISLGVKAGCNYLDQNWAEDLRHIAGGFDVIIDSAAGENFHQFVKLCNYGAHIVFYGGTKGKIQNLNPQPIFWKQISIHGTTMGSPSDFKNMLAFCDSYKITPVVDEILPFDSFPIAFEKMSQGSQFGKMVLEINS